jgi:diguanylate cyclase (GGDEF)-like protein
MVAAPSTFCLAQRLAGRIALKFAFLCAPFVTQAACLPNADPEIQSYERKIGVDPSAVTRELRARLDAGVDTDPLRRAAALAAYAESLSVTEHYEEVRRATELGMTLVGDQRNSTYVNHLVMWSANTFDEASVPAAIERLEAVRKLQAPGSPAEACVLIGLGQLEHQADRTDRASAHLTRAYRMSVGDERRPQRAVAADTLALNQEVIDWDVKRGAIFNLATTRFIRASILREMGNHAAAIAELEASRAISLKMDDPIGVAYDDLLLCQSNVVLGALAHARTQCDAALRTFEATASVEPLKQTLAALAHIDLLDGQPAQALARLNRVLEHDGRDVVPRRLVQVYELRAKAHAALGQQSKALADFQAHMQRFKAASEADRANEAAAIRARFETDREVERNAFLERELTIKSERIEAQSARLRWMVIAGLASMCVIGLLTYLLLANKKKKQLLARLAQVDELTQLSNRRRTFELASDAFDLARRQCTPLTIGILDLDHFKGINDRFGHAIGDRVLQEFARIGRQTVRGTDVLGRWGGEEFLIVLPNTTLDIALGIVDRLRIATTSIHGGSLPDELRVSLSAGLATNEGDPSHLEEIIASADAALYDAKDGGRDLVCVAPESYSLASTGVRRVLKGAGVELTTGKFERLEPRSPARRRTR